MKWIALLGVLLILVAIFHFFQYPMFIRLEFRDSPYRRTYHRIAGTLYAVFGLIGAAMFFVEPPAQRWKLNLGAATVMAVFLLSAGAANHWFTEKTEAWLRPQKNGKKQ